MKLKNLFACFFVFSLVFTSLAAQEGKESPWTFSVSTDFAFYPKSDYIKGGTHFAPITGPYSGVEGRVTGSASYKIDTPLGDHWLLNSANLVLKGNLELTPISVRPGLTATFTPLPFIVFSAGANAGTGWAIAGLRGMSIADSSLVSDGKYTNITPFTAYYLKWFAEGTFQFDTGALFPGDWTHFQIMYTYQIYSEYLTGTKSGDIWMWQASGNKVNGLSNYQQLILAYQIPWVLSRAGLVFELEGYFKDWEDIQKHNIQLAEESFSEQKLFKLEMQNNEINGKESLEKIAEILYQNINPIEIFCQTEAFKMDDINGTRILSIKLPFLKAENISVKKEKYDIIISLLNERRRFHLPDKLRTRKITSYSYMNNELKIYMDYD